MITVHHLNNSRSQRILWLLEEIGQSYEIVHYQRDKVTNLAPPELAKIHPLGKSPMVEIDGRLIAETGAIVEILCHQFAPALLPEAGTDAHIQHLELMHFAEGSAMTPILLNLYTGRLGDAAAPLKSRIEEQLDSHFNYMEKVLRPSGHFVLDDFSAVDVMLSFPAEIAVMSGKAGPKLTAFVSWIHERDAWKRGVEKGGAYRFG